MRLVRLKWWFRAASVTRYGQCSHDGADAQRTTAGRKAELLSYVKLLNVSLGLLFIFH
jgi:hypothetical protein